MQVEYREVLVSLCLEKCVCMVLHTIHRSSVIPYLDFKYTVGMEEHRISVVT